MVVTTIWSSRCSASTLSASRCVMMISLRQQYHPGAPFGAPLPDLRRQVGRGAVALEDDRRHAPGPDDRAGEGGTGVGRRPLLVGVIAADADQDEQRQFQVVDDVAERVAGLEEPGDLNHD